MFQQCLECLKQQKDDIVECCWAWNQCLQCCPDNRRPAAVKKRDDVDLDNVDRIPLFTAPVILGGIELSREAVQGASGVQGIPISALNKRKLGVSYSSGLASRSGALPAVLQQADSYDMQQPVGMMQGGTPHRMQVLHSHQQQNNAVLTVLNQAPEPAQQQQQYADDGGQMTLMPNVHLSTVQQQQKHTLQQQQQQQHLDHSSGNPHVVTAVQPQQSGTVAIALGNQAQQLQQQQQMYMPYAGQARLAQQLQQNQQSQLPQHGQNQWRGTVEVPQARGQQVQAVQSLQPGLSTGQQVYNAVQPQHRDSTQGLIRQECSLTNLGDSDSLMSPIQQPAQPRIVTQSTQQQQQQQQMVYQQQLQQQQQQQMTVQEQQKVITPHQLLQQLQKHAGAQQQLQDQHQAQLQLGKCVQQQLQEQLLLQQPHQELQLQHAQLQQAQLQQQQAQLQQAQQQQQVQLQLPVQHVLMQTQQQLLQQLAASQQVEGTGSGDRRMATSRQGTPAPGQGLSQVMQDGCIGLPNAASRGGSGDQQLQLHELRMQLGAQQQFWGATLTSPSPPLGTSPMARFADQQDGFAWDTHTGVLQQHLQQLQQLQQAQQIQQAQAQLPGFDGLSLHGPTVSHGMILASLQQQPALQAAVSMETSTQQTPQQQQQQQQQLLLASSMLPQQQQAVQVAQQLPTGTRTSAGGLVQEQQTGGVRLSTAGASQAAVQAAHQVQAAQQAQAIQQAQAMQQAQAIQQQQHQALQQQVALQQHQQQQLQQAQAVQQAQVIQQHQAIQQQQQQQALQQQAMQQQQALMLPPPPRQPGQLQQQQQQQTGQFAPPWRQELGAAAAISAVAGDKEIPWDQLQFGHQIGEGGFGKVYYGTCHNIAVAIKVLNAQAADSGKLMAEFLREVTTMTRLPEHTNVLKLLGVCTQPPNLALVTQFCAKGSLYGLLHSPGCYLSWTEVVDMLLGAARGMEHLHAHSVLHRDLKSGNLLVDHDGVVKVADFGLSRLYHGMHTMTGGLGTFQWMAPEVLANQRYSNKADIYSFGMVMWECCAREVPFEGLNGVQAALAVMAKGMRPQIPPHTPPRLAALIQECWAAVPEQRPGFDVLVVRLQELLNSLKQQERTAAAAAAANAAAAQYNAQAAQLGVFNAGVGAS